MAERPALGFGGLLRQLRAEALLTQEELADAAKLSPRSVSDLERGVNRTARKDTAVLLADALSLTGQVRVLFVAAARGRALAAEVLAARPDGAAGGSAAAATRTLPRDIGSFTGRDAELAALTAQLTAWPGARPSAMVISAISGTAGVGKTALAVHWAHRVSAQFPDGQLYVNLRGFDRFGPAVDPGQAIRGFLDAFAVLPERIPASLDDQVALYRSLLAGQRVLVVLDNVRDAEQVRPLLPGSPGCLAIVTSRNHLTGLIATQGAHPLELELLTRAGARELLASRLGARRVGSEPGPVDEIITGCARLPLALTIAAARAATSPGFPLAVLAADGGYERLGMTRGE